MVIADCFQYFETKTDNKNQKISPQERNTSNRKDVAIVVEGSSPSFFSLCSTMIVATITFPSCVAKLHV